MAESAENNSFLKKSTNIIYIILAVVTIGSVTYGIISSRASEARELSEKDVNNMLVLSQALFYPKIEGTKLESRLTSLESMFQTHCETQEKRDELIDDIASDQKLILHIVKDLNEKFKRVKKDP